MKYPMSKPSSLAIAILLAGWSASALAELQPAEIAIVANKSSQQSQDLARYYAQKRGVPMTQICLVDMPAGEELPREVWERQVRPTIRRWVASNKLQDQIRCMVTVWDVPLKIGKQLTPDSETRRRLRLLQLERARRVQRLLDFAVEFDEIAGGTPSPVALTTSATLNEVTAELRDRLKAAEGRIGTLTDESAKQAAIQRLTQLSVATAGLQVVLQNLQRTAQAGNASQRVEQELQMGGGRLTGLREGQALLEGLPASLTRDTNLIALIERATGIAGTISWIDSNLDMIQKNETHASFDSELAVVLESGDPLLRWLPNYLHFNYDDSPLRAITRTLMVSRIDAPTVELAKKIIDTSMAVEQQGLKGKVYLDARGIATMDGPAPRRGSEEDYDRSILLAEKLLTENTQLDVVTNKVAGLFSPGECPDAALYCGWFSLAKYVDAFQWNPGAIGYHMTSSEATTIHKPDSQVWCKQMLDRGVCGTIGPVYEPYLVAWPRPNELFALLCSGKYTYIECVYRTKATNSWTMTVIGDPLYNPYKAKPALTDPPADYARLFGIRP